MEKIEKICVERPQDETGGGASPAPRKASKFKRVRIYSWGLSPLHKSSPAKNSLFADLTYEQFYQLCRDNPDMKFERSAEGKLIVMPPTGWGTGNRNVELSFQLQAWSRSNNLEIAFDSSTGFTLPNGADRSPDAAWVRRDRIEAINPDPDKFLPLAPDFVVELMSANDTLEKTQAKMREYQGQGVRLGWLIDTKGQRIEIYRQGREVEVLQLPTSLSGEDVLPGFVLDLERILLPQIYNTTR